MLEMLDLLREKIDEHGIKYIIDNTKLSDGLYVKIDADFNIIDTLLYKIKTKKNEKGNQNESIDVLDIEKTELYYFFLKREFYSKMLYDIANKCIDTNEKKFHSINPFSLRFKTTSLPKCFSGLSTNTTKYLIKQGIETNKLTKEEQFEYSITAHFDKMKDLYNDEINYKPYIIGYIRLIKDIENICEEESLKEGYPVKIFMDESSICYEKYFNLYLKEKLFLSNVYNIEIDGEMLGAGAFSTTLDGKKLSLRKNSTSFIIPFRADFKTNLEIFYLSFVFDKLAKENNYYIEYDKKEKELLYYDVLDIRAKKLKYREFKALQVLKYEDIDISPVIKTITRGDLLEKINLYSNYLINDLLLNNSRDFNNKARKKYRRDSITNSLITHKDNIKGYFRNNYDVGISKAIDNMTLQILLYEIETSKDMYANSKWLREIWDNRMSIMSCLTEGSVYEEMPKIIKEIRESLLNEMNKKNESILITDDETYYFLVGQTCNYIVSQSKAKKKPGTLIMPFLRANTNSQLKEQLLIAYEKYAYSLPINTNAWINKAIEVITVGYAPEREIKDKNMKDFLMGGLIGNNIFYTKRNINGNQNNENEEEIFSEEE